MKLPATPKTLRRAIQNGIIHGRYNTPVPHSKTIEIHVADFIRQKMTAVMLRHPECEGAIRELEERLFKE